MDVTPEFSSQLSAFQANPPPKAATGRLHGQIRCGCYGEAENAGTRISIVIVTESAGRRLGIPCNA